MNPSLRGSAAHVFVDDVEGPQLDPDDVHHLARVLRLRTGAAVSCSDGRGAWRMCEFTGGALMPLGEPHHSSRAPSVHLFVAVPKGDRVDWLVQKVTEVGVARVTLVEFERSVVRWSGERAEKQLARLRRIAREASSQSRRVWLPEIDGPISVEAIPQTGVVFAEPGGEALGSAHRGCAIVIGPEGGLTPSELAGRHLCSLGEQVLRVETAAVVAAVVARSIG